MKIIGSILVVCVFSVFGIIKARMLRKRCINLLEIRGALSLLETEIAFVRNDLFVAMLNVAVGKVKKLFSDCAKYLDNMEVDLAWEKSLLDNKDALCLNGRDIAVISKLSNELGKTDCENQVRHIRYIQTLVDELYETAMIEYNEKHKLYQSSGLAIGIFLVLMII